MRTSLTITVCAMVLLGAPGLAVAQDNASRDAARGANAGASVLGQVGAVVGGVTGAAVGGAADLANAVAAPVAPGPTTVKRTTCVTDAAGNRRCDSVETTTDP